METFPESFQLIEKCCQKDPAAREILVKTYLSIIYGSIWNATRGHFEKYGKRVSQKEYENIVQELTHEVVIVLFDNDCKVLRNFQARGGCPLGGYIGTIAVRKAIDYWRAIKNFSSFQEESECAMSQHMIEAQTAPGTQHAFEEFMNNEAARVIFEALDVCEQQLCRMIFFERLDSQTIAQELNITVDNFYMRKNRLLNKLKEIAREKNIC